MYTKMTEDREISKDVGTGKYEIEYRSDGSYALKTTITSSIEALRFAKQVPHLIELLEIGGLVAGLESICEDRNGVMIPDVPDLAEDLVFMVSLATVYPDGISREDIRCKLDIKDNSRRAYINSPEKRTSPFISYEKGTASISVDGIKWIYFKLLDEGIIAAGKEARLEAQEIRSSVVD